MQLNRVCNVTLIYSALINTIGAVKISKKRFDDLNIVGNHGITVPLTTLDELLSGTEGEIRLLKIDVEGYEKFVVEGGLATLVRRDCIYIEVCEEHFAHFGYSTPDLLTLLGRLGFACYHYKSSGQRLAIPLKFTPSEPTNLIAYRKEEDRSCNLRESSWFGLGETSRLLPSHSNVRQS